jgi:tRNA G37 N-methylase TrmD
MLNKVLRKSWTINDRNFYNFSQSEYPEYSRIRAENPENKPPTVLFSGNMSAGIDLHKWTPAFL